MTPEDILNFFYEHVVYKRSGNGWATPFDAERMRGVKLAQDLVDAKTGEAVAEAGQKITPRLAKKLVEGGLKQVFVPNEQLVGSYISADFINEATGGVIPDAGAQLSEPLQNTLDEHRQSDGWGTE